MKNLLVVTHLPHLLKLSVKALILLVLFEFKLFKFTFKAFFYINNAYAYLFKKSESWFFGD